MSYPTSKAEFKNYAGKWTEAVLNLDDFPNGTKFIVGREDVKNLPYTCTLCFNTTHLDPRDFDILKQGAVIICSKCYLEHVTKEQK